MERLILRSTIVNDYAFNIAKTNRLPEYDYLIECYWNYKYRNNIKYNLYYDNQINKESIVRSLTK